MSEEKNIQDGARSAEATVAISPVNDPMALRDSASLKKIPADDANASAVAPQDSQGGRPQETVRLKIVRSVPGSAGTTGTQNAGTANPAAQTLKVQPVAAGQAAEAGSALQGTQQLRILKKVTEPAMALSTPPSATAGASQGLQGTQAIKKVSLGTPTSGLKLRPTETGAGAAPSATGANLQGTQVIKKVTPGTPTSGVKLTPAEPGSAPAADESSPMVTQQLKMPLKATGGLRPTKLNSDETPASSQPRPVVPGNASNTLRLKKSAPAPAAAPEIKLEAPAAPVPAAAEPAAAPEPAAEPAMSSTAAKKAAAAKRAAEAAAAKEKEKADDRAAAKLTVPKEEIPETPVVPIIREADDDEVSTAQAAMAIVSFLALGAACYFLVMDVLTFVAR